MKNLKLLILFMSFLSIVACDDDTSSVDPMNEELMQLKQETFYVELEADGQQMRYEMDGSQNAFSNEDAFYLLGRSTGWSCQNKAVVSGSKSVAILDRENTNREFDFALDIKRKIRNEELDRAAQYDYLEKVLNPSNGFGYPSKDGYFSYIENGNVIIENEGTTEVFIDLTFLDQATQSKKTVSSHFADQPIDASFKITKITKLDKEIGGEYNKFKYIIEGEFSCDMAYSEISSTQVSVTKGSFRLPYIQQSTESLLDFCE